MPPPEPAKGNGTPQEENRANELPGKLVALGRGRERDHQGRRQEKTGRDNGPPLLFGEEEYEQER